MKNECLYQSYHHLEALGKGMRDEPNLMLNMLYKTTEDLSEYDNYIQDAILEMIKGTYKKLIKKDYS